MTTEAFPPSLAPQISVIVPTYNRRQTLPRAVNSILNQTYRDFEIIIVDDGSTDDTEQWVKLELLQQNSNDVSIRYIRNDLQKGVSHARNTGIQASQSPWVALLDSDDEWMPSKLELQMQMAKESPDYPLIHGEEIWIRNGVRVNPKKKHQKSGGRIFNQCVSICCISPSTSLIQRPLFEEFGFFREDFPVCEDYDFWLKVTSKYAVGFIDEPLITKYGGHPDQLSHAFKAMDYYRIKSLHDISASSHLDACEKQKVLETLVKKCDILLRGYQRHNNLENFHEIAKIAEKAGVNLPI